MGNRTPLLIVGAGHHAGVVRDCVDAERFRVLGYLDDGMAADEPVGEERVLGALADLPAIALLHPGMAAVIAIGDNMVRRRAAERLTHGCPGLSWATIVHRTAILSQSAEVGPGSVVVAGAIINCNSRVGRHVLINTGSIIDHDNRIGDFASTGPGVVTGGDVQVGELSHIGIGASVCHGVRIGTNCVIGGQAFVDRHVADNLVSFGVPARPQHQRALGEAYL